MKRKCRRSPLIKNLVCVADASRDTVERLSREAAAIRVANGWHYVPKNVWRRAVR